MKKGLLIIGIVLFAVGCALALFAFASEGFNPANFGVQYETNIRTVYPNFKRVKIEVGTSDVRIERSSDEECRVVCLDSEKVTHQVYEIGTTLCVQQKDSRRWYDYIFSTLSFRSPNVIIYLPDDKYYTIDVTTDTGDMFISEDITVDSIAVTTDTGDVEIDASAKTTISVKTNTGDIEVSGSTVEEVFLESDTGDVEVSDMKIARELKVSTETGDIDIKAIKCTATMASAGSGDKTNTIHISAVINVETETGDVYFDDVLVSGNTNITTDTGDVELYGFESSRTDITTDTGDVLVTFRKNKTVIATTRTGDIDVPEDMSGGNCYINTDTGDITVRIKK